MSDDGDRWSCVRINTSIELGYNILFASGMMSQQRDAGSIEIII